MKQIEIKNLKGTEDYLPQRQILRDQIIDTLKKNFTNYGYLPLETPILNSFDLLKYKYEDGAEILNEIYTLKDQGDRDIGLRYDLTIPFCKVIALNKDLVMPFRRYEIGKVFRDGPVKLGRAREFYQCDVDVVGIDGRYIEIEQMQMVVDIFNKLGIDIVIKWNNRKLMYGIFKFLNIDEPKIDLCIALIDRIEKISKQELFDEFNKLGVGKTIVDYLLDIFSKNLEELTKKFSTSSIEILNEGISECNEIAKLIEELNLQANTEFSPKLARGLSIYTGTVFEFFDKKQRITSSLGGGGRYNKIITNFMNNGQEYPAVGLTFGLEPIYVILNQEQNLSNIDVLLIPMQTEVECLKLAERLRNENIKVLCGLGGRKVKKAFEYANKSNIKYVMVIGDDELATKMYSIKDMQKGEQSKMTIDEIISLLKNKE